MTTADATAFDDLAVDYSTGQVIEALSILEGRGELPKWAVPHVDLVVRTLVTWPSLPAHVGQAAGAACQAQSYTLEVIVGGLRYVAEKGMASPACNARALRSYLTEWRKQLRTLRPPPRFRPQGA